MKSKSILIVTIFVISTIVAHSFATEKPIMSPTPGQAEFKTEKVRIITNIQSNIYTYEVTNLSTTDIISFDIKQHAAYNFKAPKDWQIESHSGVFRTWTSEPQAAISPRQTEKFSFRVSSSGASLGYKPVKIGFKSDKIAIVPAVWTPVPEPCSYIIFVAVLILSILSLHTAILVYKDRRTRKDPVNNV